MTGNMVHITRKHDSVTSEQQRFKPAGSAFVVLSGKGNFNKCQLTDIKF